MIKWVSEQGERQEEGERESQADSLLNVEPDAWLYPTPQDPDASWNQKSDAQLTLPHRCPPDPLFLHFTFNMVFQLQKINCLLPT